MPEPAHIRDAVVRYYSEASQDYQAWSRRFNMHFGYWRAGLNPFRLEPMLDEMTRQVLARLAVDPSAPGKLLDMGSGLGGPARFVARETSGLLVHAVTIVEWQTRHARELAVEEGAGARVQFVQADYTNTPWPDGAYDGAYAIESACHAAGADKAAVILEAARILKPGARFVVADGFLKHGRPMLPWFRWCYRKVCRNWAVEDFAQLEPFVEALRDSGFEQIRVEEISYRIAPSVMHVPTVTTRFLLRELFRGGWRLGSVRWGHLLACVLSPIVGMARSRFGYYLIAAAKMGRPPNGRDDSRPGKRGRWRHGGTCQLGPSL
jgi:ubiquinone/menaquinone biosynthesis C-methylase UbiE